MEELAGGPVAPDVEERIVEHAGGNPLFAEQLLALAAEAPNVSLDKAPPTIEALIASRLDRLGSGELEVIRRASVFGRLFSRVDLEDLGAFEDTDLRSLERRGLIHQREGGFRFHHVLVRDVAYRGIPKADRAELHERVAKNLDRRDDADEIVGYHLEQAYAYRVELARADEHAHELAAAAGDRLGSAGVRAWKRADAPAAINLLERAVNLLPDDASRCELLCELGLAHRMRGEPRAAQARLDEALDISKERRDRRLELRARIEMAALDLFGHSPNVTEVLELAAEAIPFLQSCNDDRSLGRAWLLVGFAKGQFLCDNGALEEACVKAAEHYRRAGWSPSICLGSIGNALCYGPRPVVEAIEISERLLQEHVGDRASEANILVPLGCLYAMCGRFDEAFALIDRAESIHRELGQVQATKMTCTTMRAEVEVLAGRLEAAESALHQSCDTCLSLNESAELASRAAELADVICTLGRDEEAEEWVRVSCEHADRNDHHAQSSWRSVAAKLQARNGLFTEGEMLAREAIRIAGPTDGLNHKAKLFRDLAEVLGCHGREQAAGEALETAIALYEQKGNQAAADQSRALLATTEAL